jgi:tetratricopeptide (TPR) repeat protein
VTAGLRRTAGFDFPALGRQLGVSYLLDGNVRRAGENLQVSAQLVDAASGQVVWSGRFDRPLSELAALQEELVLELAGSLGAEIHVLDMQNVLRKPGDITAWEACVRVMAALRQIDPMSLSRAVQDAQNAVDIAPNYPVGHGLLAAVSGLRYFVMSPDDQAEVQRIRRLAEQALQIGQDNPFVVANAGGALMAIGHPEEGLGPLLRALRKAPALGPAHYMAGWCCLLLNRTEEAQHHLNEALRLLPAPYMAAYIKEWQANVAIRRGRWDEAEELIEEVIALAPMHMTALVLKAVLAWLGQRREAARVLFAPLRHGGFLELDQLLTLFRRGHAASPAFDDILAAIRALWTETSGAGGAS